jgi:hypothetical protein
MKSALSERARQALAAELRRMSAEQRLCAFLAHCQLVTMLYQAGRDAKQLAAALAARGTDYAIVGAMAAEPQDLADARLAIAFHRDSLDLGLLRRLAERFGKDAAKTLDELLAGGN